MAHLPFPYASQAFNSRKRTASVAAQCLGFVGLSPHFGTRYPQTADQRVNDFCSPPLLEFAGSASWDWTVR